MFIKDYILSKFLYKVKALWNLVQQEYNQYDTMIHLKQVIKKDTVEVNDLKNFI